MTSLQHPLEQYPVKLQQSSCKEGKISNYMTTPSWFLKEQAVEEACNIHSLHMLLEQLKIIHISQQSLCLPTPLTEYASQIT